MAEENDKQWYNLEQYAAYKWTDRLLSNLVPNIIEKPVLELDKRVLRPAIRYATAASIDSGSLLAWTGGEVWRNLTFQKQPQESPKEFLNKFTDQFIYGRLAKDDMDLGTGYIPGGRARYLAETGVAAARARVGSHAFTFGRGMLYPFVKANIVQEDSLPWKIATGLIDMVVAVKNPLDPFNMTPSYRPSGTSQASRVGAGGTAVVSKRQFVQQFDNLEQQVLKARQEVQATGRSLTQAEQDLAARYSDLTTGMSPNRTVEVPDPIAGVVRVPGHEGGTIYGKWRPLMDKALADAHNNMGAVRDVAPSLITNRYKEWRQSAKSTEWAESLINKVKSGELDEGEIWRTVFNHEGIGAAARLATAARKQGVTPEDILNVVDELTTTFDQGFNVRNLGRSNYDTFRSGQGYVVKTQIQKANSRLTEMLPENTKIGYGDPDQSARNLDDLMGVFGFKYDERNRWLTEFATVINGNKSDFFEFMNRFQSEAIAKRLEKLEIPFGGINRKQWIKDQLAAGSTKTVEDLRAEYNKTFDKTFFTEDEIGQITSWANKLRDEITYYAYDDMMDKIPFAWFDGNGFGPARLSQQMADNYVVIPPAVIDDLARLFTKMGGFLTRATEAPVVGKGFATYDEARRVLLSYVSDVWKPRVVAKPSHTLRLGIEEMFRANTRGILEHPTEWIYAVLGRRMNRDAKGNIIPGKIPDWEKFYTDLADAEANLMHAQDIQLRANQGVQLTKEEQLYLARLPQLDKEYNDLLANAPNFEAKIYESLVGPRSRGANVVTSEYAPLIELSLRRGSAQFANKLDDPKVWKNGMAQEITDMFMNPDYRRIAGQRLLPEDTITINGVTKKIGQHIKDGATHPYTNQPLANDLDAVKLWLFSGSGREYFNQYFENSYNLKPSYQNGGYDNYSVASQRADEILNTDIAHVTGGDQTLLDVIATGKYQGTRAVFRDGTGRGSVSPELSDWIGNNFITSPHSPKLIITHPYMGFAPDMFPRKNFFQKLSSGLNTGYRFYFENVYGRVSDTLARSPLWKASYWNRMEELVVNMTPDDAKQVVQAAQDAKLLPSRLSRITLQSELANGKGTLEGAERLAAAFATKTTNDIMVRNPRGLISNQHKILVPFFNAFVESATTWMTATAQNPKIIRNTARLYDAAEENGVITKNQYGDTVLELKGTGAFASWLTQSDEPIADFSVNVRNFNIVTQMRPGVGFVVQYVLDKIIPPTPNYDKLREFISPYDAPKFEGGVLTPLIPPSLNRMLSFLGTEGKTFDDAWRAFFGDPRQTEYYRRGVVAMHQHLINRYGDKYVGREGYAEAYEDAQEAMDKIQAYRAFVAAVGPGAPVTEYLAMTDAGLVKRNTVMRDLTIREERARKEGRQTHTAFGEWIEAWGPLVWIYAGSTTKANVGGLLTTREFQAWSSKNSDLFNKYPSVAGYLGPDGGNPDIDVWSNQLRSGYRDINTVEESRSEADQANGNYKYYTFVDSATPQQQKTQVFRDQRDALINDLREEFPFWAAPGDNRGDYAKRNREQIAELRLMTKDKNLAGDPTVMALKDYFNARDQSVANALAATSALTEENWKNDNKIGRPLRNHLRDVTAASIIARFPSFKRVWDQVLSFEFVADKED